MKFLLSVRSFLLLLFLFSSYSTSWSQQAVDEKPSIKKVVDNLFEGMRRGDSTLVRSSFSFSPTARLSSVSEKDGKVVVTDVPLGKFVAAVGAPHKGVWDERVFAVDIKQEGVLASVWLKYAFYLDDRFSHCGVDAFQLYKGEGGWKIIQLTDTRSTAACEEHKKITEKK